MQNWLYPIARNHIIDTFRKRKHKAQISEENWNNIVNEVSENNNDEQLKLILKGMLKLNDFEREIITLRYIEEMDVNGISKVISKSYSATKVAIHRALQKLISIVNPN